MVPTGQPFSILGFIHNSVGAAQVEWRVGAEGAFHPASGSDFWEVRLQLPAGRYPVFIRATAAQGCSPWCGFTSGRKGGRGQGAGDRGQAGG